MKIAVILCLLVSPGMIQAQNFFAQKKTKLKYIAQQIALLKVYTGYLKKGYDITRDGLNAINDIKHADFDLHNDYFNSLKEVSPAIKAYAQADSIANIQDEILSVNDEIEKFVEVSDYLQEEERNYIKKVMSNLLYECDKDMSQCIMLTSDSLFALTDDERIKRIQNLAAGMKEKYAFVKYFENLIKMLALSRAKDLNDAKTFKLLTK